jgi:hypothetical protein
MLLVVMASADDARDVLGLWGAQRGGWEGHIDIYAVGVSEPRTLSLSTKWDALPDHSIVTKIETFTAPEVDNSTVTLMYVGGSQGEIVTPYFTNDQQRDYRFAVVSVSVTDDTHWTTVIASPDGKEIYEGRPAVLRYVRTRDGDVIENTKEVRFLDERSDGEYELRSFIRQTRSGAVSSLVE